MKQQLINIIANTFFLALVLFAVVFLFIPEGLFEKYKIDFVSSKIIKEGSYVFYEDLNNDGTSEIIRRYIDSDGMNAMNIYLLDGTIIDQFNFGRKVKLFHLIFTFDRDNNGLKEIYNLSYSNDSIFLNWVEPMNESDNMPQAVFVTTMAYNKYGNIDYSNISFQIADLNKDGNNELLFTVNGGYSKFPRKVFAYDFVNDTLFSSPFTGAKCSLSDIKDINNDGYNEIVLYTFSSANIRPNDTIPDDEHSYLMVLDHNLNFLFEPVPFHGYPSSVRAFAEKNDNKWVLYGLFSLTGKNGESQKLFQYDVNGNEIKHVDLPGKQTAIKRSKSDSSIYVVFDRGNSKVMFFDKDMNEKCSAGILQSVRNQMDLDGDGNYEWLGYNPEDYQTILIYTHDFSHRTTTVLPVAGGQEYCFKLSEIKTAEKGLFQVQKNEYNFIYKYYKNNYYFLKYPFYAGIYLFLLLVVYIIQRLQKYQIERKLALEKQISELQLKTIRSQMDPHFTYNALNTINSVIYKEDKEIAQRYFSKFSKLVRATLDASDKITRTLNDELEFVENYLMMEKFRFKEKFNYSINIDEKVNRKMLIPKMIIQIYVENAIKHGLKHKEKNGLLKIVVTNKRGRLLPGSDVSGCLLPGSDVNGGLLPGSDVSNKPPRLLQAASLLIIIEDNGIGRKKAAELETFGTGHGMNIMENIGKLYYKLYNTEIKQNVEDLFDEKGSAIGTRVVIEIPEKMDN